MSNDERERSFEIHYSLFLALCSFVRVIGIEPTCLAASDPKSDASASFATPAFQMFEVILFEVRC
jgi:hypothetical protein